MTLAMSTSLASPSRDRPSYARRLIISAALMVGATAFIAASARVAIPWVPVPITLQTFAVLLVGAVFGARRGAAVMMMYLLEGASGLPVFAGGMAGYVRLVGPTAGYLWSFPIAAFVVGALMELGWGRRVFSALAALVIGNAVIFAVGVAWLSFLVGPRTALATGLLPFLPFDVVKLTLTALFLPSGRRWVDRLGRSS